MSNRRIAQTAALSALLHAALLLTVDLRWPESASPSTGTDLTLYLEPQDERDVVAPESDALVAVAAPPKAAPAAAPPSAAAPTDPDEAMPAAPADEAQAAAAPPVAVVEIDPQPQLAAQDDAGAHDGDVAVDSLAREDAGVLATTGESATAATVLSEADPREHREQAIPASQQATLVRSVEAWVQAFPDTELREARRAWQEEGRQYTAVLRREPAEGSTGLERATVEITSELDGERLTTRMQLKRLPFSSFTQLVDHWDMNVQLHDDEIAGRFHSNTAIQLLRDGAAAPRFLGKVTTASRTVMLRGCCARREEIFRRGIETGTRRIALPERFRPFAPQPAAGDALVRAYGRDTRIVFHADGTYVARTLGSRTPQKRHAMPTQPLLILGTGNTDLRVRGTVRGQVLVYSPSRIVIEGDLLYARDPRSDPGSPDYLGLVSDRTIEVAGPATTGRGDLEIHAALYAKRRFVVPYEDAPNSGTLLIYGSLSAGTLTATEPRYATRIEFDPRLEQRRPPAFPQTSRYEVEAWDGRWQVAQGEGSGS